MRFTRSDLSLSAEVKDFALADATLTVAFTLAFVGGAAYLGTDWPLFIYFLPILFIAVTLSFVLHELMHKIVAQRFGAIAGFRTSVMGLGITLLSSLFGFLLGIPGATVIYTSNFTTKEEGIVSFAGPLTNFSIFIVFLVAGMALYGNVLGSVYTTLTSPLSISYLHNIINMVLFISILLAFFNMLPIYPLDGSKVLRWSKPIYIFTLAIIFVLFAMIIGLGTILFSLVFMLVVAFILSLFYRGVL
ncbi:MAG: M50 family metallopeptidase [Candidatus Micrarchaeaceae archaeon]